MVEDSSSCVRSDYLVLLTHMLTLLGWPDFQVEIGVSLHMASRFAGAAAMKREALLWNIKTIINCKSREWNHVVDI